MCSFSLICSSGANSCFHNYISLYPTIWSDAYNVLYWSLFSSWFIVGMYWPLFWFDCWRDYIPHFLHQFLIILYGISLTGHECQSTWNCLEANIVRNEPTNISSNMGLHCYCCHMYYYSNELFK